MNSKKNLKRNLLICLLAGSAVMYTLPLHAATSVIGNGTLPSGGHFVTGGADNNILIGNNGLQMDITQSENNAVITWKDFNVGGSATVNFWGPENHNTLNYVNGGNMSQIYGTINANNNGNIFIVNPAGVQIGNSAQINVGSLYVSNKYLNESELGDFNGSNINDLIDFSKTANAELMSLGNINAATNVTFDGDRIVLDTDRIIFENTDTTTEPTLNIRTTDSDNIVLGYEAYNEQNGYADTINNEKTFKITEMTIDNSDPAHITFSEVEKSIKGYMWVEDVNQLQAIDTNLDGNYALRNSIDATATSSWDDNDNINEGFKQIGTANNEFTGKFDGLDYNIFGLTINRSGENNVGLFGVVNGATINNVTLVGGSITGGQAVGAIVGSARDSVISNSTNSTAVNGDYNIGGIVGDAQNSTLTNLINTGTIGAATGVGNRIGGLVGNLQDSSLGGNSYNLGAVTSVGHDVGGLVGHAYDATIGDGTNLVYNRLDVTGSYNVGGIVGNMESNSTVQNAENSGTVLASGSLTDEYNYHTDIANENNLPAGSSLDNGIVSIDVNVANVGGIAGSSSDSSTIKDVTNTGDVSSRKQAGNDFYDAGNVGGIVGSAVDTNITNATNRENEIRGAHNVGGVAGYFGNSSDSDTSKDYTITNGINDGGDIMATGARNDKGFARETIRADYGADNNDGNYIIGNIGGVVGYMDGNNVYITQSANRGTVHTDEPGTNVEEWQKAANVGGIVGKIDRSKTDDLKDEDGKIDVTKAAVSNSYNTGDVRGYTAVGGIAGMMYNGEIAGSYNLGKIRSTRIAVGNETPLNMGGIVGDTTENSTARAYLYDVYNKGQIGDETYTYKGRHVGGIAGRLSGTIEKAYNAGAIYNGAAVTGGIAGYLSVGSMTNVFNTGNITVENNDGEDLGTQLGGLVGAANIGRGSSAITNAYNLGVIRSFNGTKTQHNVGGIVGAVVNYSSGLDGESKKNLNINNVYTTGDLYSQSDSVGAVYGSIFREVNSAADIKISNVVYITPTNNAYSNAELQSATKIDGVYGENTYDDWNEFITKSNTDGSDLWRVYKGTTPILNEFTPNSKEYFHNHNDIEGITSIQYGTAYNPLLTIIEASKDLSFDWQQLRINNDAGLAVYGAGVTLNNFKATGGTGYYGGLIYADGKLNLDGNINDISLGSASQIYGSSVTIETDGKVTIYGNVTATGNDAGGEPAGDITVTGGDVDVYGQLTSATKDETTNIAGIGKGYNTIDDVGNIINKNDDIANMGEHYAHTTGKANKNGDITIEATETKLVVDDNGEPILDANGNMQYIDDGDVNIYYGNKEQGLITTGGNLTVTGTGDVYVDSDLDIGGNLTLNGTGADSEVVLDITNIGQVRGEEYISRLEDAVRGIELTDNNEGKIINAILEAGITNDQQEASQLAVRLINTSFEDFGDEKSLEYFHEFMHHFSKVGFGDGTQAGNATITLNAAKSGNTKLTIDMWNDVTETYDLTKYDEKNTASSNNHTLLNELNNLNIVASTLDTDGGVENTDKAQKVTYIWVSSGEQLKGIQTYYDVHKNDEGGTGILSYNFALKGDINASHVEDYEAIGGKNGAFNGTFDGRGNRIIGLDTTKNSSGGNTNSMTNAGIFSTVGAGGVVKDVNIYSGNFTGTDTAGAVAGVNSGRIEGVVTFGNTVTSAGNAGGIVGENKGSSQFDENGNLTGSGIYDVESTGSVIAGSDTAVAGGLVGTNNGALGNSFSDSAVTVDTNVTSGTSAGLGGVVGINNGNVQYVDSLGVTNGGATGSSNIGGIIGTNNGNMYSGYNESIVSGNDKVGGIIGENKSGKTVSNVVNATSVTGATKGNDISENVGGLVGYNEGSVTNGRNNGTITGNTNVGGLVGNNASKNSVLTNLVNDSSAAITGEQYVGGIAGNNAGTITTGNAETDETVNLINRGTITGQQYVGGVAGSNSGIITNANNDVELNVKDSTADAEFFGGIAGENTEKGIINNATNTADVNADGATYVGGIVGLNNGTLENMAGNSGNVTGENYVGGVAGKNNTALDGVIASNDGTVKATEGGAGGIFAENKGNITNSTLTNNMVVAGGKSGSTGGIIGVNSGHITYSSLKNEADAQVIGMNNVGGLIGKNTGDITGGRDAADSYYKYQIYNNGVINVGTWKDDNNNGIVEDDEVKLAGTGSNIGGLFGTNSGKVTAGYNTGAINASGSTNVGGIAGSNAGTIDQVFNTVMTENGQNQTITGGTNVGGLVGDNTGTITNAYNTSNVVATNQDGIVGNLVGTNSGTVQFVYGVANNLIGSGTDAVNGYVIDTSDQWKQEGSYAGFTFGANGWKIYNGYSNPMLSVFLTKVTVVD